jgi:hypothetical protein
VAAMPYPAGLNVPRCMTSDEFKAWQRMDRRLHLNERAISPCVDCVAGGWWHREAQAAGLCDGTP